MTPLLLFGGSGDLARAKVLPAVLRLRRDGTFPAGSPLVFVARRPLDVAELLAEAAGKAPDAAGAMPSLLSDARAIELALGDEAAARAAAARLPEGASAYASLPPSALPGLITTAGALHAAGRLTRLAVEKPLGHTESDAAAILASARAALGENLALVDHYAWKAATRGFADLAARGETGLPAASGITHVALEMREAGRVGRRASFYDEVGATRDVFQSHGLLLIGRLIAAATGATFAASLSSVSVTSVRRARYVGYEDEGGVTPDVETAARATLHSSLLPAAGITATYGKALPNAGVSLAVSSTTERWRLNVQPEASIVRPDGESVRFGASGVGYDAYEGALAAAITGNFSAAPSPEEAILAWRVTDGVARAATGENLVRYEPGDEPAW